MNSYPFLNNKHKPIFTSDLADIVPRVRRERTIDITSSPVVPASSLRAKLEVLHRAGELDGGLPILRDGVLVGLIPAPDLEYALDGLRDEGGSKCLMAPVGTVEDSDDPEYGGGRDPCDFTAFVDPVSFFPFFRFLSPSFWEGPFSLFRRRGCGRSFANWKRRRRSHWTSGRPWTWCTSALSSWGCGISVSCGMASMPAW